ncbi:MAG: lamin tail domain-containing protein [bacterium]
MFKKNRIGIMWYQHRIFVFTAFCMLFVYELHAQIKINEIVSSNSESCYDEFQNAPDWIEIFNSGSSSVNLNGYRIFDKNNFQDAWILPDTILQSGEFIVIFASGESRNSSNNFVIEASGHGITQFNSTDGMRYEYLTVTGDFDIYITFNSLRNYKSDTYAALMVREELTDDSKYAGMFCQNPDKAGFLFFYREQENENPFVSYFYNRETDYPNCTIRLKREGNNITGYILDEKYFWYTKDATISMSMEENTAYVGIALSSSRNDLLSKLTISNIILNGDTIDIADFNSIEFNTSIPGKKYKSKEIHTNFKLDRDEGTVYLWNASGSILDSLKYDNLMTDVSYGLEPDGAGVLKYFEPSTPGKNNQNSFLDIAKSPEFSNDGGWFTSTQFVTLNSKEPNGEIYFTLDGSEPDEKSQRYTGSPIKIDTTTLIRSRAFRYDCLSSEIINNTYFINDSSSLQVLSLAADPFDLWNEEDGIFVKKNLYNKKEIPISFELWSKDKTPEYEAGAGAKVHGQLSKSFPQKSLRIYARGKYGTTVFKYPFFGKSGDDEYETIILRNGGTEWWRTLLRDGFAAVVAERMPGLDAMAFSPSLMFINGSFYGIQNIRERIDESYIHLKYDVPYESIDLLEDWDVLLYGSSKDYHIMYDSVINYDMSSSDAYAFIDRNIDITNIMSYVILEMYVANIDWPWKNLKYWKSTALDNKWRWVINDMDYTCGIASFPQLDMVPFATDGKEIFSRFFPKLLENERFKIEFINRTADMESTLFLPNNMLDILDSLADILRPEIPRQHARYDSSAMNWEDEIDVMRDYLTRRHKYFPTHYLTYFNLKDTSSVTLDVQPTGSGKIQISTIIPSQYPWHGKYFQDVPVKIQALPNKGYKFSNWSDTQYKNDTITINFPDIFTITAYFSKEEDVDTNIVINEIMYNNDNNVDTEDWIELYNAGNDIDISGWTLKDDNDSHIFTIPENTILTKENYLILCRDTSKFSIYHFSINERIGNFDFGFAEDDMVRLFDKDERLIDNVDYDYRKPWPTNSDGTGNSIELINTDYDNELAENWRSSIESNGTPGRRNSTLVDSQEVLPANSKIKATNYPNPFSDETTIEINLDESQKICIKLFNDYGFELDAIVNAKVLSKGIHYFKYKNDKLSTGMYYLQIQSNDGIFTSPVVILR